MRHATVLLLLAACSGTDDTDAPAAGTPGGTPSPADSGTPLPSTFDVGILALGAQFGFDAASGELSTVLVSGQAVPPTFEIYLGKPSWDGNLQVESSYCTVAMDLLPAPTAHADSDPGLWRSFAVGSTGVTDCVDLDPALWTEDVVGYFASYNLGVAVGEQSADLSAWLTPLAPAGTAGDYFGGEFLIADLVGADSDMLYGSAFEVDAAIELVLDTSGQAVVVDPLVLAEPTRGSGWYSMNSAVYYQL